MDRRGSEIDIARGLCSSRVDEQRAAIGAFVRLFTFSAPTALSLIAADHPETCAAYAADRPLVRHLLDSLPLPEDLALAWRIALLNGDELARAVHAFHERYGNRMCQRPYGRCAEPDEAYQRFLFQIMTGERFRQTCFGKYAGEGKLISHLRTAFVREANRARSLRGRVVAEDLFDHLPQRREECPERSSIRAELRTTLMAVLQELASDVGLLPFVLEQGLDMTQADVARILRLHENAVRQRIFRFRGRFRRAWKALRPNDPDPFATDQSHR